MEDIVIVAAARTAVGKFGGTLAKTPATELGATVIKALLERTGLPNDAIGEVIMGQVLAAGVGQNPARQAMMKAGVAKETPALTRVALHQRQVFGREQNRAQDAEDLARAAHRTLVEPGSIGLPGDDLDLDQH